MNNVSGDGYLLPWHSAIILDNRRVRSAAIRYFQVFTLTTIVCTGIFGNVCSFLVMTSRRFRVFSYSQYLAGLAVADSVTLIGYVPPLMNYISYPNMIVSYSADIACGFHEYIFEVNDLIGSWVVVVITIERFAIVVWPFATRTIATPAFSRQVVAVTTVVCYCTYVYLLFVMEYSDRRNSCVIPEYWGNVYYRMAPQIHVIIPIITISILNFLLVIFLRRSQAFAAGAGKSASTKKATMMVITVSILFVIFTFPASLFSMLTTIIVMNEDTSLAGTAITGVIYAANAGINFYIYLLAGDEVRLYVKEVLGRLCNK
ncbi:putative G-protein coupled receptor B0563.6 [Tubulanus polymorphus]|uniref:putative G-protein coupled receptor B0563.6 n=1 Tax=Tubulanus polymorphus TaxID=672921 RepID=UPI003DA6BBE2